VPTPVAAPAAPEQADAPHPVIAPEAPAGEAAIAVAAVPRTGARARKETAKAPPAPARKPAVRKARVKAPAKPVQAEPKANSVNNAAAATAPASKKEIKMATSTTEITDKFQTAMKDASEKAKTAFEKSQAAFGDMGEFTKGNVEAMVASAKILASGIQEMSKGLVEESKSAFETITAEAKDIAASKSPSELFEKQTALLRKHFDAAVAAGSKNSEAMLKLANEAFQPISTRVSLAVEKVKKAA
jgi:phasin family protein